MSITKHGHSKRNQQTPEYEAWRGLKKRCLNKNTPSYKDYGGRGISVCEKWANSFESFLLDMGKRPSKNHSVERVNNDGNYEPANCKWATRIEQSQNRRPKHTQVFYKGESTREASLRLNGHKDLVRDRVRNGWAIEKAFNIKPTKANGNKRRMNEL